MNLYKVNYVCMYTWRLLAVIGRRKCLTCVVTAGVSVLQCGVNLRTMNHFSISQCIIGIQLKMAVSLKDCVHTDTNYHWYTARVCMSQYARPEVNSKGCLTGWRHIAQNRRVEPERGVRAWSFPHVVRTKPMRHYLYTNRVKKESRPRPESTLNPVYSRATLPPNATPVT